MTALQRALQFIRDERGSELAEYALVMTAFTLISLAAIHLIGSTANQQVESDSNNFADSLANGY
jgi:Flp pilus assembly pilin Flp